MCFKKLFNKIKTNEKEQHQYIRDGEYVFFGEYPQTIKDAQVIINDTCDSRGYYRGSDGEFYAKIRTEQGSNIPFSNNTQINANTYYYFKVEPIKWRIIYTSNQKATLLCEQILDINRFCFAPTYQGATNNYMSSLVRAWLNKDFYNIAFNKSQKKIINTTLIDNSSRSATHYYQKEVRYNADCCANTYDKVWLLSFQEITKLEIEIKIQETKMTEWGTTIYEYGSIAYKKNTDFAKAKGALTTISGETSSLDSYLGNFSGNKGFGSWWLRSPADCYYSEDEVRIVAATNYAHEVSSSGVTNMVNYVIFKAGIVPVINISL